jgi:hypothetical protein
MLETVGLSGTRPLRGRAKRTTAAAPRRGLTPHGAADQPAATTRRRFELVIFRLTSSKTLIPHARNLDPKWSIKPSRREAQGVAGSFIRCPQMSPSDAILLMSQEIELTRGRQNRTVRTSDAS